MPSKAYLIGFRHGNNYGGTNNWKPGNRKPGSHAYKRYSAGWDEGQKFYHESTLPQRRKLAELNKPKAERNPERPRLTPSAIARAHRNPDIHIDIGSHNATRAKGARTNPKSTEETKTRVRAAMIKKHRPKGIVKRGAQYAAHVGLKPDSTSAHQKVGKIIASFATRQQAIDYAKALHKRYPKAQLMVWD